jgi:hypothetical protein
MPGETSQEAGRSYVFVFGGCLERTIKRFSLNFDVYSSPDKVSFNGLTDGSQYSFDLSGVYEAAEVFVECKGYKDGANLLEEYKTFLAKAYCTSVQFQRHRRDLFWFVTNVPFGTSLGRRLWSSEFIGEALRTRQTSETKDILGGAKIDSAFVRSLAERVAVGIFTDSFIKVMGTQYRFRPGDTLWSVTKLLHGGRMPLTHFGPIEAKVQHMNNLSNPNLIRSGKRIQMPWFGMPEL